MSVERFLIAITSLGACNDAREWVATQPDAATAWASCPRADWLVWLLGALHVRGSLPRKTLVLAACACAETALCHAPAHDDRPRLAIEAARRWTRGEATVAEVRAAADAARAYAAYAAADAAADNSAAADYAYADYAAAAAAADAAAAAYTDAYIAAYDAARNAATARAYAYAADADAAADAVRGAVPWETVEAAINQMETT